MAGRPVLAAGCARGGLGFTSDGAPAAHARRFFHNSAMIAIHPTMTIPGMT